MSSCSGSDRRWRIASRSAPWVMKSGTSAPETVVEPSDPAGTQWIERATGIGLRNIMKPLWIGELKAAAPLRKQRRNHTIRPRTGKSQSLRTGSNFIDERFKGERHGSTRYTDELAILEPLRESVPRNRAVWCMHTGRLVTPPVCILVPRPSLLGIRVFIRTTRNVIGTHLFVTKVHFRDMRLIESLHNRRPVYSIR